MIDRSGQGSGEPAVFGFNINVSDLNYLPFATRAIYVGGAGNIALMTIGLDIVIFMNVVAGTILPVRAIKVFSTGTTAVNLVGLY